MLTQRRPVVCNDCTAVSRVAAMPWYPIGVTNQHHVSDEPFILSRYFVVRLLISTGQSSKEQAFTPAKPGDWLA